MKRKDEGKAKEYVVKSLALNLIEYVPQQLREIQTDDDIPELAASIAAYGLLQLPGVRDKEDGTYQLLWGRRRLEAHKLLQWPEMLCRVYEAAEADIKVLALIENLARRQMNLAEECRNVADLHHRQALSVNELVEKTGRTRTWILQRLAIPSFPVNVREHLLDGSISLGAAEEIARLEDEGTREYIINQTITTKAALTDVRTMVRFAEQIPDQSAAIEAAIESSRIAQVSQPLKQDCAICGRAAELSSLTMIKVHAHGCPDPEPTADNDLSQN